jgi:hypothetical protein
MQPTDLPSCREIASECKIDKRAMHGWTQEYRPNLSEWERADILLFGRIPEMGSNPIAGRIPERRSNVIIAAQKIISDQFLKFDAHQWTHAGIYDGKGGLYDLTKNDSVSLHSLERLLFSAPRAVRRMRLKEQYRENNEPLLALSAADKLLQSNTSSYRILNTNDKPAFQCATFVASCFAAANVALVTAARNQGFSQVENYPAVPADFAVSTRLIKQNNFWVKTR